VTLEAIPLKLSDEQLAKLNAAQPKTAAAKKADPAAKTAKSAPASPNVIAAAPRATPPAGVDAVGLILARAERHE
jgi:hypothetical protein